MLRKQCHKTIFLNINDTNDLEKESGCCQNRHGIYFWFASSQENLINIFGKLN